MIGRSQQINLGQDRTRIKDPRDAERQHATVDAILSRLFHSDAKRRRELQILADEVGMGKTFVALAVAYSLLDHLHTRGPEDDLRRCYRKVLVVTPRNSALFAKWQREVGEFVKRCVKPAFHVDAAKWFAPTIAKRPDDLVLKLQRRGAGPEILITDMGAFSGARFLHYDIKRRYLLGVLFRYWANRFRIDARERLLKGAPSDWPADPDELLILSDDEWDDVPFDEDALLDAVHHLVRRNDRVERLLQTCREIAQPYKRYRDELFSKVERQLDKIYRRVLPHLIRRALPLVIVDEAHNWKNGPATGANGYREFVRFIGRRTRRVLMLTATPFQLRPDELLEVLKLGDELRPCTQKVDSQARCGKLRKHREEVIRPVLKNSDDASRRFARAWARLPASVTTQQLAEVWQSQPMRGLRSRLREIANRRGVVRREDLEPVIEAALVKIDPDVRQFVREALRLYVYNSDLSHELGFLVIRHRRRNEHRAFRIGLEFRPDSSATTQQRPDRHVLHPAPGLDVKGDGELPHYILMRCVSEMKRGKGRSSLGNALTGCYSTLIHSAEGKRVRKALQAENGDSAYLNLLTRMVGPSQDPKHPKVREVVKCVLQAWLAGEKTLIFCFRTNTAERLRKIIAVRIGKELDERRRRCLGGLESLRTLRTRLTGRDRDLVVLGLDRVLWSFLMANEFGESGHNQLEPGDLVITTDDLQALAAIALTFGVDLRSDRVDRVFLNRATEYVIATRVLDQKKPAGRLRRLLSLMSGLDWVSRPYGVSSATEAQDRGEESAQFDERGAHTHYVASSEPKETQAKSLARYLQERRERARSQGQVPILDAYGEGPGLWLGPAPMRLTERAKEYKNLVEIVRLIHERIWRLTEQDGEFDWQSRLQIFQALRRAVLRESVLLRLLPERTERDEAGWGELLVQSFFDPMPRQNESMAHRIAVFLEDLMAASGGLREPGTARYALYDATRLRDQQFVALVWGNTDSATRERIFSGFNTPLLPEVLICTSVGQEGIDLHRHCRYVVHYDLAWNPAVLEQRTGRADRIGSKTFRERDLASDPTTVFLEIGVPFLAGTYDERMYEELRLRSQTFEVLTGGDLAADNAEGQDDRSDMEGKEGGFRFVPLPEDLVNDIRVKLHVWSDTKLPMHITQSQRL